MPVYISDNQNVLAVRPLALRRRLGKILTHLGLDDAELSVLITDDREIRQINAQYRGQNRPTNVLSFPMEEEGEEITLPEGAPRILGDIVISAQTIQREAALLGYSEGEMFYFYLIHGLLHLLGYDHERSPDEAVRQEMETDRLWNMIPHSL